MYCALCGIFLQDENQEGIVCRECKQALRKRECRAKRRVGSRELAIICVRYCFRCGLPYHPADPSIQHSRHLYDFAEETKTSVPGSVCTGIPFRMQGDIQKEKEKMYALLVEGAVASGGRDR